MSDKPKRETPSAPDGYRLDKNLIVFEIDLLYQQALAIAQGKYRAGAFAGPPGIGKTWIIEKAVAAVDGAKFVHVRADANTVIDVMHKHRHEYWNIIWDDTNYIYQSVPLMNRLNHIIVPQGIRRIVDNRPVAAKGKGKGTFEIFNKNFFLTNKPLFDPNLSDFDKDKFDDIRSFVARFTQKSEVGYLPDHRTINYIDLWHYSSWVCTDGDHKFRKMSVGEKGQEYLTLAAGNEVLRWWADNYKRLADCSPRELQIIAEYRLNNPEIWEALAERRLLRENDPVRANHAPMEAWEMKGHGQPTRQERKKQGLPTRVRKPRTPKKIDFDQIGGPDGTDGTENPQ